MISGLFLRKQVSRAASGAVACLLFVAAPVHAELYLTHNHPDGIALLAPPPAPNSPEQAADLATVRAAVKARTAEELTRANKDASLSLFNFEAAIGPMFKRGTFPKMEAFFETVKTNISDAINTPKDHWHRLRPYQLDRELVTGKPEKSSSYPSGHSTRGTVQALMLAELFPEHRDAILEFGRQIGWDRIVIGKHFPSDIRAGRVLGQAIFHELMANPAFQRDLAEVKKEVQQVTMAKAAP